MLETIIFLLILIVLILSAIVTLGIMTNKKTEHKPDNGQLDELNVLTNSLLETQKSLLRKEALYEERYNTMLELIPHIFYTVDMDGAFTYARNTILLGWEPDELLDKHFKVLFHHDCIERISRDKLLERLKDDDYRKELIDSGQPPGLVDEHRTGARITKREPVVLVYKDWNGDPTKIINGKLTVSGLLSSAGVYSSPVREKKKEYIGSIGLIELEE